MPKYALAARPLLSILVAAVLVVMMDVVIMPILLEFYFKTSPTAVFVLDFLVVLLAGLGGLFFAQRVGCPIWSRQRSGMNDLRSRTYIPLLLGLSLISINTVNTLVNINQALQTTPWIALLTPGNAIAISFRAAINEEIVFRLLLFPLVTWIVMYFTRSQRASLVTGALVSAIIFGLIHGLGFIWAFFVGLALTYIFFQRGLLITMAVHFFTDVIPFLLIFVIM